MRWPRIVVEVAVAAVALAMLLWAWWADLRWFERHVLVDYCACTRAGVWLPRIARGTAVAAAVVLGLVVRPRLGRWVARSSPRDLAWIAMALVAAIIVSDLVVGRIPTGDRTPVVRTDMPRAVADPRFGWRFVPAQTVSVSVHGRAIAYAIDADGDRAATAGDRIDPDLPTIVVAGESVAFGESVPWDETFAAMLGADRHVQIVDVGVPAYASDQAYLRVQDALARLHHPIAVVTTFIPKMIRRNGQTTRPHLVLGDAGLVLEPADDPFALTRLWRDEPYHGAGALELTRAVLAATAAAARAHGAAPLFLVTNFGPPCLDGDDAWIFHELFDGGTIPSVRVELLAEDTVGHGDMHPDVHGARKLADAVERALAP